MPVIEYCTFWAALCLNCGAVGPAALKVTAWQGCHGECLEPETLWEEHFLLPQVCFECEPVGFGLFCSALLGRGIWLSASPHEAHAPSLLQLLLVCLSRAYLSQHECFSSSKHSWLQDSFGTWKVSAFVWTHYAVCILPALLLNWADTCVFCCFFLCSSYFQDSFSDCVMRLP